ncbi:MAG: hypothetical protein FWD61_11945 [Phycisphaerales bacterium]|nr:hypothetical protein [Phycisphaerales bacterium]
MRLSYVIHAVAALTVVGSCAVWAADNAKTASTESQPVVAARTALGQTIHELNVDAIALERVINFLRDVSGTNIIVDWKVLEAAGVNKQTPISLQVRELTLRKMLQLVLDQASPQTQLVFSVDSNVLEITSQEEADKVLITKVYIVDDLVMPNNHKVTPPSFNLSDITKGGTTSGGSGGGTSSNSNSSLFTDTSSTSSGGEADTSEKRGADLVSLIRDVIRPSIWKENGGTASIKYFSGKLVVTAPVSVHEAIGGPVAPEGGQRFGM